MSFELPQIPKGSGGHPLAMVVISARDLAASSAFYSKVFGWIIEPMSPEVASFGTPAGPQGALRAGLDDGFPALVPYLGVTDVAATLARVLAAGGTLEKAPWSQPGAGNLARFKSPGGTLYGLTDALISGGSPRIPMPFGTNPKPVEGAICSVEMYAADGDESARFFREVFGWGTAPTMPQFVGFDPGAGICGVFQSHTPSTPAMGYIYARDVATRLTDIEAAGGKRMCDPMNLPGMGCFGYFTDPSGTPMGLIGE